MTNRPTRADFDTWFAAQTFKTMGDDWNWAAFQAGVEATIQANAPKPGTFAFDVAEGRRLVQEMAAKELARIAALPPGTCPDCEGDGVRGGQFCGGFWTCESCGGKGKTPPDALTHRPSV